MLPLLLSSALAADLPDVRVGDILFHESTSAQSAQIQAATGSRYSHVGVVVFAGDRPTVLEGVQPVKLTPLAGWIDRGVDDHYAWRRPAQPLTPEQQARLATVGLSWLGRDYDSAFRMDYERLYCSELVYKLYRDAVGIELGELRPVSDFHVADPAMLTALQARGISLEQPVISPADILRDDELYAPGTPSGNPAIRPQSEP